jgi:hypothetical protein
MDSDDDTACAVGCPIRKPRDRRSRASPPGFSQRAASFIASQCQGIHQMPLITLSTPNGKHHIRRNPTGFAAATGESLAFAESRSKARNASLTRSERPGERRGPWTRQLSPLRRHIVAKPPAPGPPRDWRRGPHARSLATVTQLACLRCSINTAARSPREAGNPGLAAAFSRDQRSELGI